MQTSQKSIFDLIEETSTSSAGASPANPTQAQASDLEKKMTATSGLKCCDAFGRFPRVGSWAKTFSALLIGQAGWSSMRCRLIWKLKASKSNRMYFQLQASTLPTEEIESGLLLTTTSVMTDEPPEKMRERAERNGYKNGTKYGSLLSQVKYGEMLPTPTAGEHKHGKTDKYWQNRIEKGRQKDLSMQAYKGMLPTPTTDSATNRKEKYKQGGTPLSVAVNKMLPTPTAFDYKSARTPETYEKAKARHAEKGVNLQMPLKQMARNGMLPTPTTRDWKGKQANEYKQDRGEETEFKMQSLCGVAEKMAEPTSKPSQLNPQFVEEMMGFPENWTASPFQSGATKA